MEPSSTDIGAGGSRQHKQVTPLAFVTALAKKHGVANVGERINPRHIQNARAGFAAEMLDRETALILCDRSFLGNGKAGMLVTDRAIYSSTLQQAIPLAEITSVKPASEATKDGFYLGSLLVNDRVAYKTGMLHPFLLKAIVRLTKATRRHAAATANPQGSRQTHAPAPPPGVDPRADLVNPRFVETAAASALRGRRAAEIEDELLRLGAAPKAAKVLAVRMAKKAKQARSPFPVLLAVGGAISVVVAIAVLVFFGDTLKSRSIFKLLGGAVTGAAALTAGVKSMRIAEKHRTLDRLIAAWAEDRDGRLDA